MHLKGVDSLNNQELHQRWLVDAQKGLSGWDFSHLQGRCESTPLPWDLSTVIHFFLKPAMDLLDMGTGGGEFLLSIQHPSEHTFVTEGYPPNLTLCRKKLEPLGITVRESCPDGTIPYESLQFDVVMNRHDSFDSAEVYRVLKPGGYFVTQQVGGLNHLDLSRQLIPGYRPLLPNHTLIPVCAEVKAAGFQIILQQEFFPTVRYYDVGALVFMASVLPWEFPEFSVDRSLEQLLAMHKEVEAAGAILGTEHRFLMVARK